MGTVAVVVLFGSQIIIFGLFIAFMIVMFIYDPATVGYMREQAEQAEPGPNPGVKYRLDLNIKPIRYSIHIRPHMTESDATNLTFDGQCIIEIQALQNTKQIQLHMSNLKVSLGRYYKENSKKTHLPQPTPNSLTDIVVYNLNEELQANVSYYLHFVFDGSINAGMNGVYRSKYTAANATHWLYATQFETTDARKAFPCFDEPEFKAKFSLSITHNSAYESVGPTAVWKKFSFINHETRVYYKTTPIMSTYLLTFTITKYHVRQEGQIAVFARPEYLSQTEYSIECGKILLAEFSNYFYTNLSTIAENIIHLGADPTTELGESSLLYDKKKSSLKKKQLVTNIVAFKVAHLWFGYLVTFKWWSDPWMTKGLAFYFQYIGTDLVDRSFDMSSQFVVDVIQNVMYLDATGDARPMSIANVRTKDEINHMLNTIAYLKAAALMRMTKEILQEQDFRAFLKAYLNTHAYKNTTPRDFLKNLANYWPVAHPHFCKKYFESFITKEGYAVVTFNRTTNTTVVVTQSRFLLKDFDKANRNLTYVLPITYTTNLENNFRHTVTKFFLEKDAHTVNVSNGVTYLVGNIQAAGYYRVNYDNNTWYKIAEKLFSASREDIHVANRAQIVDDLFQLARGGVIGYRVCIYTIQFLKHETSYLPLAAARRGLHHLMTRLGNESFILVPFIREIVETNYQIVGFDPTENESYLKVYRRTAILEWACKNIISDCVDQAKVHFDEISNNRSVDVNILYDVYCTVVCYGNETYFNTLANKYTATTVSSERTLILDALTCVKDSRLVDRVFQMIISNDMHALDRTTALYNLCNKNNENVDRVFYLIDENVAQLANALGSHHSVASLVLELADFFTIKAQLDKLTNFNKKHSNKFGSSISTLQRAVSIVEENLKWSSENLDTIKSVLAEIAPIKS